MKVKDAWLLLVIAATIINIVIDKHGLLNYLTVITPILFFYLSWICELLQEKKK